MTKERAVENIDAKIEMVKDFMHSLRVYTSVMAIISIITIVVALIDPKIIHLNGSESVEIFRFGLAGLSVLSIPILLSTLFYFRCKLLYYNVAREQAYEMETVVIGNEIVVEALKDIPFIFKL
jgi:hypothetical protein